MECQIKDINVYYELFGEGRPIIMLHGWSVDHRHMMSDMEPIFKQRDGWKRIYLDLPGHGNTPEKKGIANQDMMLNVILDFIDKLVPGQRFVIAGTSAGAYLARGVVYRRSASMDGLLLTVPLIIADDAKRQVPSPVTLVADSALMSELKPDEVENIQQAVVQSRKVVDYMRANFSSISEIGSAFQAKLREPENYAFSFDVDAVPRPFPAPTLIVTGRQDSGVGYRDAWEILDNYPRATFVVLDRSGHFLPFEQENLFDTLVGEWLDRVEEYTGSK
jgi:pimeloyl-ACP methyl ester carboxylesterase